MIEAYCKQFFGYGRWDAPVWFVGLEEAGAGTAEVLQTRLEVWDTQAAKLKRDAEAGQQKAREVPVGAGQKVFRGDGSRAGGFDPDELRRGDQRG